MTPGEGLGPSPSASASASSPAGAPSTPPSSSTPPLSPAARAAAACARPEGRRHAFSSITELRPLLTRRWIRCPSSDPISTGDTTSDVAGVDIDADGRFAILSWNASHDGWVRELGIGNEGTIALRAADTNIMQLDFAFDNGWTQIGSGPLTDGPRALALDDMGVLRWRYVSIDPADADPSTEATTYVDMTKYDAARAACTASGGAPRPIGADPSSDLTHVWLLCGGKGFTGRADEVGVELRADGRYSILSWDPSKRLVRGTGVSNEGKVDLTYIRSGQLNMVSDEGGTYILHVDLVDGPLRMHTNNEGVFVSTYAAM